MIKSSSSDRDMSAVDVSKVRILGMTETADTSSETPLVEETLSEDGSDEQSTGSSGKFTTLPPNLAALAGIHLLDAQNALTDASAEKRTLAAEQTELMGTLRLNLAHATYRSLMQDATKQYIQGGLAIAGGAVSGALFGSSLYIENKVGSKIGALEDQKTQNQKISDMLRDADGTTDGVGSSLNPVQPGSKVESAMKDMKNGVDGDALLTGVPQRDAKGNITGYDKSKTYTESELKEAASQLKAADKADENSPYTNATRASRDKVHNNDTNIGAARSEMSSFIQKWSLAKEAFNGVFVQGTSGIIGGVYDAAKAEIEEKKVLRELTHQGVVQDRQLHTDSASKYAADGSKSLDLLNQIRANNRYNG